jgi:hypothetical protein
MHVSHECGPSRTYEWYTYAHESLDRVYNNAFSLLGLLAVCCFRTDTDTEGYDSHVSVTRLPMSTPPCDRNSQCTKTAHSIHQVRSCLMLAAYSASSLIERTNLKSRHDGSRHDNVHVESSKVTWVTLWMREGSLLRRYCTASSHRRHFTLVQCPGFILVQPLKRTSVPRFYTSVLRGRKHAQQSCGIVSRLRKCMNVRVDPLCS